MERDNTYVYLKNLSCGKGWKIEVSDFGSSSSSVIVYGTHTPNKLES